jgi:hypothetical protein
MITIYKTNYEFYGSTYVLCFSFSEDVNKRINTWESDLDKMVLDEQITTGSFRGRFPIDDDQRSLLENMRKEGIIQPYYGAINPSACNYALQINPPICTIGIEHTTVEEKISFDENTTIILQAKASEVALNHKHGFMIKKKEYQSLQKWDLWNEDDEFTSRYIYTFSPTSVGVGIKVTETLTKDQIDISDYSDW